MELPVHPHRRRDRLGVDEVVTETDLAGQCHGIRDPGQHRVGTFVDVGDTGERSRLEAPARVRPAIVENHLRAQCSVGFVRVEQTMGGGQTGDAATDDGDARGSHRVTLRP
jgi:hypothetical protein